MMLVTLNGFALVISTLISLLKTNRGGAKPYFKFMNDFNECCFNCNLMDLNFFGPRFTWKNERVQKRLDWVLVNFNFFSHFKEAHVMHLNWFKSDHRPILLKMEGDHKDNFAPHHFRFLAAWVTENSFKDLVKNNWKNDEIWPEAIASLIGKIKDWNNDVFWQH